MLKHISQAGPPGSNIHIILGQAGLIRTICDSGVWDEKTDGMAEVLQVSAIGVVKHMCNGNGRTSAVSIRILEVDCSQSRIHPA